MTEENKSWFSGKFDELMNSFNKKEEVAPKVEEQPKEETISKEEVSEMLNSVKGEISKAKEENDAIVNSKEEEIKNLKAELEKLNAVATEAKAENKSPEGENKKEVETASPFINKTVARLNNKYKGILKIK